MFEIDTYLLNKTKIGTGLDAQLNAHTTDAECMQDKDLANYLKGCKRIFCQMFEMKESEATPEKIANIVKSTLYNGFYLTDDVTAQNSNMVMANYLEKMNKVLKGDKDSKTFCHEQDGKLHSPTIKNNVQPTWWMHFAHFVFGAYKEAFDRISPENEEKLQQDKEQAKVTLNLSEAAAVSDEKRVNIELEETQVLTQALKDIDDKNIPSLERAQLKKRIAIYNYAKENGRDNLVDDNLMFNDVEGVRDLGIVEKSINSTTITKKFGAYKTFIPSIDRPVTRQSTARILMLADGHSFEEVFSNDPKYDNLKREYGKKLIDMLEAKDMSNVMRAMGKCEKVISSFEMPPTGSSIEDVTAFYVKYSNFTSMLQDYLQILPSKSSIEYRTAYNSLSADEKKSLDKGVSSANVIQGTSRLIPMANVQYTKLVNIEREETFFPSNMLIGQHNMCQHLIPVLLGGTAGEKDDAKVFAPTAALSIAMAPSKYSSREEAVKIMDSYNDRIVKNLNINVEGQINKLRTQYNVPKPQMTMHEETAEYQAINKDVSYQAKPVIFDDYVISVANKEYIIPNIGKEYVLVDKNGLSHVDQDEPQPETQKQVDEPVIQEPASQEQLKDMLKVDSKDNSSPTQVNEQTNDVSPKMDLSSTTGNIEINIENL